MTIQLEVVNIWILPWAGLARGKCKGKKIASHWNFLYFFQYCIVTVQYCCSVSKEKHDQVFSAALLNGHKIQISLQLPDPDLKWRVVSMAPWTLISEWLIDVLNFPKKNNAKKDIRKSFWNYLTFNLVFELPRITRPRKQELHFAQYSQNENLQGNPFLD